MRIIFKASGENENHSRNKGEWESFSANLVRMGIIFRIFGENGNHFQGRLIDSQLQKLLRKALYISLCILPPAL